MAMDLKAIVFDFNGTLVNDLDLHIESYWRAGKELGYALTKQTVQRYISYSPSKKRLFYYGDISDAQWDEIFSLKQKYYFAMVDQRDILFPDTESALCELAASFALAVVSNTFRYMFERLCPAALSRLFQATLFFDEVVDPKPSAEPLRLIMQSLGVAAEECCYAGDSLTDIQMAKGAGVRMFAIATGNTSAAELAQGGADHVAANLSEFVRQIRRLSSG
jgi:HAD superfamily hydrolase (TIGR01549 family)